MEGHRRQWEGRTRRQRGRETSSTGKELPGASRTGRAAAVVASWRKIMAPLLIRLSGSCVFSVPFTAPLSTPRGSSVDEVARLLLGCSLSADDTKYSPFRYRKSGQRLPVARCLVYFQSRDPTCKLRFLFFTKKRSQTNATACSTNRLKGQLCSNVPAAAAADQQMGLSFSHRTVPMSLEMPRQMVVPQQPQHRHRRHHRHANRSARCEAVPSAPPSTVITTPPPLPATAPAISAQRRQHAPASSWAGSTTRPVRASPDRNPRSSSSCGGGRWPIASFAPALRACAGAPCSCCIWHLPSW